MDQAEELIEIYPKLKRYALSKMLSADDAEDCAQEACTRILEQHKTFENKSHLTGYAITTVRNLIIDLGRKAGNLSDEKVPERPINDDGILVRDINIALMKLGSPCQDILEYFGLGYSYEEISRILTVKLGTVMSRMSRCRKKFKSLIEGK